MRFALLLVAASVRAADNDVLCSTEVVKLMPFVGNGFVATHPIPGSTGGIKGAYTGAQLFVAGVFSGGQYSANRSHRAVIPSWVTDVSPAVGAPTNVSYCLYLRSGVLTKRWAAFGGQLQVNEHWLAHRTKRSLLLHIVNATSRASGLRINITQQAGEACGVYGCDVDFQAAPSPAGVRIINGSIREAETPSSPQIVIAAASVLAPAAAEVVVGKPTVLVFGTAVASTLDAGTRPPADVAADALAAANSTAAADLMEEHTAAWGALWDEGSISVAGDDDLAQTVNASLYYILSSTRTDWPYGLSPGGLASAGYHGHTFWDQESWMWPPLLLLHQPLARAALQYRIDRQEGAAALARHFGHPGLRYPWESALTGVEVETRGGKITYCSNYEIHISGDIVQAFWRYWQATKDMDWLKSGALDVVAGIAEFYVSRVAWDEDRGGYGVTGAMGPDEYHYPVNNSAYVNAIAALSVATAAELSQVCGAAVPANWSDVAAAVLHPFDNQTQRTPEYDGYKWGEKVKQADAVMVTGYPLADWLTAYPHLHQQAPAVARNDLEYYSNVTPGGPAMTWGMFAIGSLDLEDDAHALPLFRRGYENARPPFKVWTELADGGGCVNFITGAGGFLQSVLNGYAGIRVHRDSLALLPHRPPGNVTEISVRGVHWRGSRLQVRCTTEGVGVTVLEQAARELYIEEGGCSHGLQPGTEVMLQWPVNASVRER